MFTPETKRQKRTHTPEQRDLKRQRLALVRASERPEQREERLRQQRVRTALSRQAKDLKLESFNYDCKNNYQLHSDVQIGLMEIVCKYCQAKRFKNESPGLCCSGGKIVLPIIDQPPEPLYSYMSGETPESKHFLQHLRMYNSCFQMTSFGAKVESANFMPTFKVLGQIYHKAGSLLPMPNESPKFLQIYFVGDEATEAAQRCHIIPTARPTIVLNLQRFFHEHNNLVHLFKIALEMMPTDDYKVIIRADKRPEGEHERRFNAPTINEVAIVKAGDEYENRDIAIYRRTEGLQRISETHRSYDALQYPLILWSGQDGYNFTTKQTDPKTGIFTNKKVSAMDFYAFLIMIRINSSNHLLKCRQLFHQFIVDMYVKIESERLLFIRLNQKKLRVENYIHLKDAVANDGTFDDIGQMVILPATFTGSPRHMHEYAQDAMSYVRIHGRPDLFITFTCNPTWKEIKNLLLVGQVPSDRHDITARVFRQKLIKLMNLITKNNIYGETLCWMYSIEWQKRGLPHAHILVWLKDKIHPSQVDRIISAEFPNPAEDPLLFDIISKNMVHGPCGLLNPDAPCMKEGKCTKRYPREPKEATQTGEDGYPLYRRKKPADGGFSSIVKMKLNGRFVEVEVDNKWVVPYTPLLCKIFEAHINVEYCNSVKSIKYICKYVHKGSDMAVFGLTKEGLPKDEIAQFQMGRYISSNEAIWRILNFPIHDRYPPVTHLSVHLENYQRVYFTAENVNERVAVPQNTTLTAFFQLCQKDLFAKTLLYAEVPKYYTWNATKKLFQRRKVGTQVPGLDVFSSSTLGRVYTVHPNNPECFFLRLLLHTVRGPTSFNDLKCVDGEVCETYRQACQKLGLLENDMHWDMTLSEASEASFPAQIRNLFALIISTCNPSSPSSLWGKFKELMSEDILNESTRDICSVHRSFSPEIFNEALIQIEDKCISINGRTLHQLGLEAPVRERVSIVDRDIIREKNYNISDLSAYVNENKPLLLREQKCAYDAIIDLIHRGNGGLFFLDAPGGTGKTFMINLLLSEIRSQGEIAIAVASSGIASTLLFGGRTAHSALKLPLNMASLETPVCNISKCSGQAKVLKLCKLIVWDECTMAHKKSLEALDRTLQDLKGCNRLMGGTVVVLAGDFRQTLPVIPKSTAADELNACLKASPLWRHVVKMTLTTNMRVQLFGDISALTFANQLLRLGNGKIVSDPITECISFPDGFCNLVNSVSELVGKVFPDISSHFTNFQWLCERAILAPRNDSVNDINSNIQSQIPGPMISYKSVDTVVNSDQAVFYPVEFLNSLEPTGMPPHNLSLKIGSPIMLLRNLDPPKLCNGTRLCIKKLHRNVIEATVLTGSAKGEDVFIPRIPLIPSDLLFEFRRLQFPIRLAFAMTINKSQGQSLKVAGLNLESPCFSHGQLYVACSRVGSPSNLFIYAPGHRTKNIVYSEALS